jgi:hypothetical protein
MSKRATLLLITVLAVSSLIIVSSAFAQSITKPSIPEFTAEYVDYSYDIAPTYTTDPYTNNTVIQTYGSHVDNRTVVITIKNEPFTPFTDSNGNTINLFYNVRYKGTFGQDWTEMYGGERTVWYNYDDPDNNYGYKIQNYASQNTVVVMASPAQQGQMDIQVEALQGYTNRTTIDGHIFFSVVGYTFYGEESGWSSTQTIAIGGSQTPTPSPETTPTPTPPNFGPTSPPEHEPLLTPELLKIIVGVSLAVAVTIAGLGLLIYFIKRK